jgi:hypothetical protein
MAERLATRERSAVPRALAGEVEERILGAAAKAFSERAASRARPISRSVIRTAAPSPLRNIGHVRPGNVVAPIVLASALIR